MKRPPKLPHWPPRMRGLQRWLNWPLVAKLSLGVLTVALLTTIIFVHLDYYQVGSYLEQFRAGQPSPRDILATHPVQLVDELETARLRKERVAQITPAFRFDANALTKAEAELDQYFSRLQAPAWSTADSEAFAQAKVPAELVQSARTLSPAILDRLHRIAQETLREVMSGRIEEGQGEKDALRQVETRTGQRVHEKRNVQIVTTFVRVALRPTWVLEDEAETETRREKARDSVNPVVIRYKVGDVITRKGEVIAEGLLQQLRDQNLLVPAPLVRVIPFAALMLLGVTALAIYLRAYCAPIIADNRKLLLLAMLIITPIWVRVTLDGGQDFPVGLVAIPAGSMAIAGLLGVPVALISLILISLAAGLTATSQFSAVVLTLGSALAGAMMVSAIWPARRAVPAVVSLIVVNFVLLLSLEGAQPGGGFQSVWMVFQQGGGGFKELALGIGKLALFATAGGLGATMIAVGAIYMLARPFGITTHYRLMELSSPNQPLLRRLMLEAPGTYHSSVMVANIAEAAADAIGADALLTRVAAMYHDIGKLKRPAFFVENQAPLGIDNVHDRLSPKLSYLILTSHVRDGAETARQAMLPQEVVSIIREHHGTTLAAFFYHRAVSEADGKQISEHEFRYPGPKPTTREAAVVMLADSVQASVKALKEPTPNRIENMVHEIINSRLADGQLEDCDITLRDLRRVSDVCIRILTGLYTYTRVEYPDIKGEGTRIRVDIHHETPPPARESPLASAGGS